MNRIIIVTVFFIFKMNHLLANSLRRVLNYELDLYLFKMFALYFTTVSLPLLVWTCYKRQKTVRATKEKLGQLRKINLELFDEVNLKNRMTDIFMNVHNDLSERGSGNYRENMTSVYHRYQQKVFFNTWDSKGLMKVCNIREINSITPIHVSISKLFDFEGSNISYVIKANMEDYLVKIENSSEIEGRKGFKNVETVWTLKLENRIWKVDSIEKREKVASYIF